MLDCVDDGEGTEMKNTARIKFQSGWGGPPGGVKKNVLKKKCEGGEGRNKNSTLERQSDYL